MKARTDDGIPMSLHLSNGDATRLAETGLPGRIVFWRDVLHEGPVPGGLPLADLSALRADFIHSRGWATAISDVARGFRDRDDALASFRDHSEVVLWFEHDLYDQLQIIQILDWLAHRSHGSTKVSLICIDRHPEVKRFSGLGQLSPHQLAALFPQRSTVTQRQLALARRAWSAFTAPDPGALVELIATDTSPLPFLRAALRRLLEQYPWAGHGLSRTEAAALRAVQSGAGTPGRCFGACQDEEEAPFMGDWPFATEYVAPLITGKNSLLSVRGGEPVAWCRDTSPKSGFWSQPLTLTDTGLQVLAGKRDRVEVLGLDRWYGGCHLGPGQRPWRWDSRSGTITAT